MAIKLSIKKKLDSLKRGFLIREIQKKAMSKMEEVSKHEISKSITTGRSPVNGFGRFQKYSDSYSEAIEAGAYKRFGKRKRPVNLTLSGDMMKSFFTKIVKKGDKILLKIGFKHKLADIHNEEGAGKSKTVRRLLPTNEGEEFNRSIFNKILKVARDAVKEFVKKK